MSTRRKGPSHLMRLSEMIEGDIAGLPEREPTKIIISVNPTLCRMNDLHRRKEIDGESLDELASSIDASGQTIPAKGWRDPASPVGEERYILIYGARRRAAAERLGISLRLELVAPPDESSLFREMYCENTSRKNYSPYERGLELMAYLEGGAAESVGALSKLLGEPKSTTARYIQIAKLPQQIVQLYSPLTSLTVRKGELLARACCVSEATRDRMLAAAASWVEAGKTGDPTPALMLAASEKSPATKARSVDLRLNGKPIGKVTGLGDPRAPLSFVLSEAAPGDLRRQIELALSAAIEHLTH